MSHDYRAARDRIFGLRRNAEGQVIEYIDTPATIAERALLLAMVESLPNIEPSRAKLARMLGTNERQVSRLLRSCEDKGLIAVRHVPGRRSSYVLTNPCPTVTPDGASPLSDCQDTPDGASGGPLTVRQTKQKSKADKEADKRARPPKSKVSRRKPETPIPDPFVPLDRQYAKAKERGVDCNVAANSFRLHAKEHDRRCRDWHAAFDRWLEKERPQTTPTAGTPRVQGGPVKVTRWKPQGPQEVPF